jgi:fatty acid desaturase
MAQGLFRNTPWDLACLAVIPFQIAVFLTLALTYQSLPLWALALLVPALFLMSIQAAGASHNHYHTPFFKAKWMNTAARMGYSMIAYPKTPYDLGHGIHHALHDSWNESSILEILGVNRPIMRQILNLVQFLPDSLGAKYMVLLYLVRRAEPESLAERLAPQHPHIAARVFRKLQHSRHLYALVFDLGAWLALRLLLIVIDWQFFLFFFIPASFLVELLRQADNFTQHWGATDPSDPKKDSVSCYGLLYNMITFNLGYHQEHHYRPAVHWRYLHEVTAELPDDRRVVPFCHWINFPIFYPELARKLKAAARP